MQAFVNDTVSTFDQFPVLWLAMGVFFAILIRVSFGYVLSRTGLQKWLVHIFGEKAHIGKDSIVTLFAKALAWFVFIIYVRLAVQAAGFTDIERFLQSVINYLPSLFMAIIIAFLGIRVANMLYGLVYQTAKFDNKQTAKVIANLARVIILFFTLTIVLDYTRIVDEFMIRTILVGFIACVSLATGLAFGLGGRDFAREVIQGFRNTENPTPKKKPSAKKN